MPIAFSKDARTTIYLKDDLQRPESERVGFLCRFITCRQREIYIAKIQDAMKPETPAEDTNRLIREALAIAVIGPVNAKAIPCTLEGVEEVLTPNELWELVLTLPSALTASEVDLKKSMMPSSSNGGTPAKDTPPANAAVVQPQPSAAVLAA